jgi:hypothetical protein
MALAHEGPAPYTSPSAIIHLVDRFRERGLQIPFEIDVLVRAGISEGLAPRTLHALRQLDLIDEQGNPTEALEGLRVAPSGEFKDRFAEVVRAAYAPIFQYVDPATNSMDDIRDAFRVYTPHGQQGRMVTLFLGLVEYAGMIPAREKAPRVVHSGPIKARARGGSRVKTRIVKGNGQEREERQSSSAGRVPEAITALLRQALPETGAEWTPDQRSRFLKVFEAILDFSVPVGEPSSASDDGPAGEQGEVSE